jgi:soluble lytic murein transglycosylase-like protein
LLCWLCVLAVAARAAETGSAALQEASIEKQRASARVQEAAVAARNPSTSVNLPAPSPVLAGEIPCERSPASEIREIVDEGARRAGLSAELVRAVVRKESAYNPCASSIKGAQGLMQLMPSVQAQFGVTNAFDPRQNVDAGTRLLKQLLDQYSGDLMRALSAYNAGPARVDQLGGVPPYPETGQYVSDILGDLAPK